jgi:hypothetical protein
MYYIHSNKNKGAKRVKDLNLENITEQQAEAILKFICAKFNVVAKSCKDNNFHDVSYLETKGEYDDNFHAVNK